MEWNDAINWIKKSIKQGLEKIIFGWIVRFLYRPNIQMNEWIIRVKTHGSIQVNTYKLVVTINIQISKECNVMKM